jgi:hypothetical protein
VNNVGYSLRVRCRARSAAPDCVVDLCELVRHSICDVCTRRRPTVCAQYYAVFEVDCHAGGGQKLRDGGEQVTNMEVPRLRVLCQLVVGRHEMQSWLT